MQNATPYLVDMKNAPTRIETLNPSNRGIRDPIDALEIFDLIRHITDPEHPLSLEALGVVTLENIMVEDDKNSVLVFFTPTIPHCSMATLIGLSIKVKLLRCLPKRFKINVHVAAGTHSSEKAINKQLSDKERVAAALENDKLISVVNSCLERSEDGHIDF